MSDPFFHLQGKIEEVDETEWARQLDISKHIRNVQYTPDRWTARAKVSELTFENVSFSKTILENLTFRDCTFTDCLFIGSELRNVRFHHCKFERCNFFRARFIGGFANPKQFKNAITAHCYSNVAVELFQNLRENYGAQRQREFKRYAEFQFSVWKRREDIGEAKKDRKRLRRIKGRIIWAFSVLNHFVFGYGYRLRYMVVATAFAVSALVFLNYKLGAIAFSESHPESIFGVIYFTITTMATLGASGFDPKGSIGYALVIGNVVVGITLLTAAIGSVFRRVCP